MFVIAILNSEGEVAVYLTDDGKMTGSFPRAYQYQDEKQAKEVAEKFCAEYKGITFIAGEQVEYNFGYEIQSVKEIMGV